MFTLPSKIEVKGDGIRCVCSRTGYVLSPLACGPGRLHEADIVAFSTLYMFTSNPFQIIWPGRMSLMSFQDGHLLALCSQFCPELAVELGAFQGGSFIYLLQGQQLAGREPNIIGFDPYPDEHINPAKAEGEKLYKQFGAQLNIMPAIEGSIDPPERWLLLLDSGHAVGEAPAELRHWIEFKPSIIIIDDFTTTLEEEARELHGILRKDYREVSLRPIVSSMLSKFWGGVWVRRGIEEQRWEEFIDVLRQYRPKGTELEASLQKIWVDEYLF